MANEQTRRIGRPSLEDLTGEETQKIKLLLTQSQYEFILNRGGLSSAAFIRFLIRAAMTIDPDVDESDPRVAILVEQAKAWDMEFNEIFGIEE